jgi:hypothetical protein
MEQGVSIIAPFRKCNLIVSNDYVKRLTTLGFSNYSLVSSGSELLRGGSTIPMKDNSWPLNGREVQAWLNASFPLTTSHKLC